MQWNRESSNQVQTQQDVYSDVKTPYSSTQFEQDNQEFSLANIQQRLGVISTAEETTQTTSPDLMPSSQTLEMNYVRQYQQNSATATQSSTKTKVLVASYVVVALALVLAVTLCGVTVSASFAGVNKLAVDYSELEAQVAQLSEQAQYVDYDALAQRAEQLGYIDASKSNTLTYERLQTRPAQNFAVQTNWFDTLCDWICEVIGG